MEFNGALLVSSLLLLSIYVLLVFFPLKKTKKLPPGPNGLPLLGSLITIGNRPHENLDRLAKRHGPLMTVRLGFVDIVVASSPETAREIFQKHDRSFIGRVIPHAVTAETGYHRAMTWLSGGKEWQKLRKICSTQIFTSQKLDSLQDLRNQMIMNMVDLVGAAGKDSRGVHIGQLVFGTVVNLLSKSIFSVGMLDLTSDSMKELQMLNANIMLLAGKPNLADYFPILKPFDPQGIKREIKVSYDRLHELIDGMIKRRIEQRSSLGAERYGDLLDVLLDYTEQDGTDGFEILDVKLLLVEIFIGGTDTTTTTVEWVMAELLRNPTVLLKVKLELSDKIATGVPVKEQDASRLPYLTAVIKESLRLHPTAPLLLPHRAEEDVEIYGYTIPKNIQVLVNAWSIARDPAYWEEPQVFKPERFLNTDIDFRGGKDLSFISFGAGRRICPGINLAVRMVSLIVATLVHNFDWVLPGGKPPEELNMEDKFGVTLQRADPLVAIPVKVKS